MEEALVMQHAGVIGTALNNPARAIGTYEPMDHNDLMWSNSGGFRVPGQRTQMEIYSLRTPTTLPSFSSAPPTFRRYFENYVYLVNYDAILYWIKNTGPNPFPPYLRSGGIVYYNSIPDTINLSTWPMPTTTQAQRDQRFWKEYIDEMLGIQQTGRYTLTISGATNPATGGTQNVSIVLPSYNHVQTYIGYGSDIEYANTSTFRGEIYPRPDYLEFAPTIGVANLAYMDYRDNPDRPVTRFWFGPMHMVDFIGNLNMSRAWHPGTCYESPLWQCKVGVQAAIQDTMNNHPNDQLALISFSRPTGWGPPATSGGAQPFNTGYYNLPRSALGRNYNGMIDSLWFPQTFINTQTEISIYDTRFDPETPRAVGGTDVSMGLMLAYNQFAVGSSPTVLKNYCTNPNTPGIMGGLGRKGAQKVVILQTDGVCSATTYENDPSEMFDNQGAYNSYFKVRLRDSQGNQTTTGNEYPTWVAGAAVGSTGETPPITQAKRITEIICNYDTNTTFPGFSLGRKPVKVHCIAFGSLFDPANTGSATVTARNTVLDMLQYMQYVGKVQQSATDPLETYKVIYGDGPTKIDKLRTAFQKIMQDGYSVSLIR